MRHIHAFLADESGPTAVEYAVMLGLILMSCIGAISLIGLQNGGSWGSIHSQLQAHGFGS